MLGIEIAGLFWLFGGEWCNELYEFHNAAIDRSYFVWNVCIAIDI